MHRNSLFLLCGLLMVPLQMTAQLSDKVGTTGFQFLKIGVGARETALAEAGTAIPEGTSALFWNVAGLTNGDRIDVQFFYNPWFATVKQTFTAVKVPLTEDHIVGISLTLLSMDDMEETTIDQPQGTGRKFAAGDLAVGAAYAQRISDRFSAGISAKYIREYIWDLVADGWVFDFGLLYRFEHLYLGMALKDFGVNKTISGDQLEMEQQVYPDWETSPAVVSILPKEIRLPSSFQFGVAYDVISNEDHELCAMGNLAYYMDIAETQNLAVEYTYLGDYTVRAGYKFNRDILGLTLGGGVRTSIGSTRIGVDFAAVDMGDFGYQAQFSLLMSF